MSDPVAEGEQIQGRQTALGIALLFFGPAVAFLFFYSPDPANTPADKPSIDAVEEQVGRARKLPFDVAEQSIPGVSLPSTAPTQWSRNSENALETPWEIEPRQGKATNQLASQTTIPREYESTMVRLAPPKPTAAQGGSDPLTSPPTGSLSAASEEVATQASRFGAGAYRPKVAPSSSPDRFPKPSPLPGTNLLEGTASGEHSSKLYRMGAVTELQSSNNLQPSVGSLQPLATLSVSNSVPNASITPSVQTVHHSMTRTVSKPLQGKDPHPPTETAPKFVHQPKKNR